MSDATQDKKPTDRFSLAGRSFLVTGGARGIGLCTAKGIAQLGGNVAIIDYLSEPKPEYHEFAEQYGVKTSFVGNVDVADKQSLEAGFQKSLDNIGGQLHGCVTAAGLNINEKLIDADWDASQRLLNVNVMGSFWTAKLVAKHLVETKTPGSIVFICSISGQGVYMPVQQCTIYNASKAAIKGIVGPLAVELGPHGIRVNCISPGCISSEMVDALEKQNPTLPYFFKTASAAGRLGVAEDLNPMITYLLSDAGSFSTGADMLVTGGITSGHTDNWSFRKGTPGLQPGQKPDGEYVA